MTLLLNGGEDLASFISDRLAVEADGAWVEAFGTVEDGTVEVLKDGVRSKVELTGPWDLLRLTASLGLSEYGSAVLARSGEVVGGLLIKAKARGVSVRVTTGVATTSAPAVTISPRATSSPLITPPPGAPAPVVAPPAVVAPPPVAPAPVVAPPVVAPPLITPPPAVVAPRAAVAEERVPEELTALRAPSDPGHKATHPGATALPPKPARKEGWMEEVYPDEGDRVNHFAFGECTVVGSDGERIRLQQDRDSRVREVALSMLKIAPPTIAADGKKHWNLARKN